MPLANKGLGADQPAGFKTDLRLIEHLEFTPFCRPRQSSLQCQTRFKFGPEPALKKEIAAAPSGLCLIQSEISITEKFVCRRAVFRKGRHADAAGDAKLTYTDGKQGFAECEQNQLCKFYRPVHRVGAADNDGELITAQPGNQAVALGQGAQSLGNASQQLIAAGVAEGIVDLLEFIEQCNLALLCFCVGERCT